MTTGDSVQDRFAPRSICFGCGPANPQGLRIKSRWEGDTFVARWRPEPHHTAWAGTLGGGIIGVLLDCHSNWCAATTLLQQGRSDLPSTVTAELTVRYRKPTPLEAVTLTARAVEVSGKRVVVEAEVRSGAEVTATGRGLFVEVGPEHPAYDKWR